MIHSKDFLTLDLKRHNAGDPLAQIKVYYLHSTSIDAMEPVGSAALVSGPSRRETSAVVGLAEFPLASWGDSLTSQGSWGVVEGLLVTKANNNHQPLYQGRASWSGPMMLLPGRRHHGVVTNRKMWPGLWYLRQRFWGGGGGGGGVIQQLTRIFLPHRLKDLPQPQKRKKAYKDRSK